MRQKPNWTVFYNIVRPGAAFLGCGYEFFYNEDAALSCYNEQARSGNVPTMRPFHSSDADKMNVIDRQTCGL